MHIFYPNGVVKTGVRQRELFETDAVTLVLGLITAGTCAGASSARATHDWIRTFAELKDVWLIYTTPDVICYCKKSITIIFH